MYEMNTQHYVRIFNGGKISYQASVASSCIDWETGRLLQKLHPNAVTDVFIHFLF
jgi:hypothetical protein